MTPGICRSEKRYPRNSRIRKRERGRKMTFVDIVILVLAAAAVTAVIVRGIRQRGKASPCGG